MRMCELTKSPSSVSGVSFIIIIITGMFVIDEFKYLDERGEEDLGRQSSEQVSYCIGFLLSACCDLHRIHTVVLVERGSIHGWEGSALTWILDDFGFGGIMDDA